MSISVLASRSRQRAVLAGASMVAVVAVIGSFESNVVEIDPVAPDQYVMQAHATAKNAVTERFPGSALGEPVSYRLTDDQDDQTDQADDDWAQQQEEEEQQEEQEQQDWDQLQNQINTQQQLDQQAIQQSEQEAQEQNDAAEQQAEQDEQQAQMDEQQANQ